MASIKEQLMRIAAKKGKTSTGKTIEQTLMEAVDYLYMCIQREIDNMYESYTPKVYERRPYHDGLRSALYVEDFLDARIVGNSIQISLKFSSNVWAWNFNKTHKSPVNILMLNGWKWQDYNGEEDRFRRFDGYDYITKGIDNFNKNNKWGLIIDAPIIDNTSWY